MKALSKLNLTLIDSQLLLAVEQRYQGKWTFSVAMRQYISLKGEFIGKNRIFTKFSKRKLVGIEVSRFTPFMNSLDDFWRPQTP